METDTRINRPGFRYDMSASGVPARRAGMVRTPLPTMLVSAVVALLALSSAVAAQTSVSAGTAARDSAIRAFAAGLRADVETDDVGSIAAGIVVDGRVIWADAFGRAVREPSVEASDSTIYRTGSISKSLTALVLAKLIEQGTVSLDDRVIDYLPEFGRLGGGDTVATRITLRQLASHTAGLIREPDLDGAADGPIGQWEDKIIASIPTTTLQSPPGTEYSYSNIGYGILGLTLSRAAGEPFMELMQRLLFDPLGMTSSTFVIRPPLDRLLSAGYVVSRAGEIDGSAPLREQDGRGYKVPNGGVYSTVHDLARIVALMSGRLGDDLLRADSRALVMTPQTPPDGPGYGLGFFLDTDAEGHRVVYHSGSVAGYNAWMGFNPDLGIGVILFRNYAGGSTNLGRTGREMLDRLVAIARQASDSP